MKEVNERSGIGPPNSCSTSHLPVMNRGNSSTPCSRPTTPTDIRVRSTHGSSPRGIPRPSGTPRTDNATVCPDSSTTPRSHPSTPPGSRSSSPRSTPRGQSGSSGGRDYIQLLEMPCGQDAANHVQDVVHAFNDTSFHTWERISSPHELEIYSALQKPGQITQQIAQVSSHWYSVLMSHCGVLGIASEGHQDNCDPLLCN